MICNFSYLYRNWEHDELTISLFALYLKKRRNAKLRGRKRVNQWYIKIAKKLCVDTIGV